MALLFDSFILELLTVVVSSLLFLYWYVTKDYGYWKKRKVPYVKPIPCVGNLLDFVLCRKSSMQVFYELYNQLKGHSFGGVFMGNRPAILIRDPQILKNVFAKDFNSFVDHTSACDDTVDPLINRNLFCMNGQKWKTMRAKLSPTFTSGKLKKMFHLISRCGENLVKHLELPARTGEEVDMQEVMAKYTTDSICSCVFGLECCSLKDPESEFRKIGSKIFEPKMSRCWATGFFFMAPQIMNFLRLPFNPKEVQDFIRSVVSNTINHREESKVKRNDFIDILMELKKYGKVSDDEDEEEPKMTGQNMTSDNAIEFDNDDIMAQAMLFYEAGFETSSKSLSFALYELAVNPDVQRKLRAEIEATLRRHGGKVTYEAIVEMEYLDRVVLEGLRKYPPLPVLNRVCTKDYKIPGSDFTLKKGTDVLISVSGVHHDPDIYRQPEKFDPDRFTEENKSTRPSFTFLPFGEGPRNCIGARFAYLQVKVGIIHLLSNYELVPTKRTTADLDSYTFFAAIKGGLWMKAVKLQKSNYTNGTAAHH